MIGVSSPTPWLDSDERAAWMSLVGMLMTVPPAIDAQLKRDSGINFFEYSVLAQLSGAPHQSLQMSLLAQLAGGSLSRLSHAASRLEKQGLVARQVQVGEVRCTELMLTEAGRDVLVGAAPGHVREARRLVFDGLSDEQVAQLRRICRVVLAAASPDTAESLERTIAEADAAERRAGA